jgi:phosphatidylglycerol lysyltransferase
MSRRNYLVELVVLVTLGSGLLNLYSVMGRLSPYQRELLREVFPLDFIRVSRFFTLLIGFFLAVSSVNLYKRKKRAFQFVFVLACLSVVFHLSRGFDYREAVFSLLLTVLLFISRGSFTVKSSIPDFSWSLTALAVVGIVAISYGSLGFWLLDRRDFGIDFTLGDSIRRTLLFFSLIGDPKIVPHTRHAQWFIDSLYLITAAAAGYSAVALYRPTEYRYRTLPRERALAKSIVEQHGRSSLDFFKVWPDKSYFFSGPQDCFIAYRVESNMAIVLGDPVGPLEEIEETLRSFIELCHQNGWSVVFHQTLPDFLPIYRSLGFRKLKIGDDAIVDLESFTLNGRRMKRLRNNIHHLTRSAVHIVRYDPPIPEQILAALKEVSDDWLQIPGRRERSFTMGRFSEDYLAVTPILAAVDQEGRVLAFVNLIPSYRGGEATIDLMRHRIEVPNGIMDYLFIKLFEYNRELGYHRVNLGMAPVAGFKENEKASREERTVHFFLQGLTFIFSFGGLRQYKAKFASQWEPRYCIYRNVFSLPRFALALAKVTEFSD